MIPKCRCGHEVQDENNCWDGFVNFAGDIDIHYMCPECGCSYESTLDWEDMVTND